MLQQQLVNGLVLGATHASFGFLCSAFQGSSRCGWMPGGNLMVHTALNRLSIGDVIVVDAGGDLTNAIMGELTLAHAQQIGIAGVIVNGAVRRRCR
jgi:hypothetical protein